MAELDLYDLVELESFDTKKESGDVSVEIINKGGDFSSILEELPAERNFITIAVKKYMNSIKRGGHFVFSVTKNIPSGAGLGGGSSNAAAALMILSRELNTEADDNLRNAASSTGSDVPFFLEGRFAFIEGRGELVSPVNFTDESFVILVNNGIHINTGFAYNSLKKPVSDIIINCDERKKSISEKLSLKSTWKDTFKNDFEDSIFRAYPQIAVLKEKMYSNGAFFASMTGSGSTVFGLYNNEKSAHNVKNLLEKEGNRVYYTKFRNQKN